MMSNKKSSRMSAWKALYVIPLVGISLAATAETKVDYLYEGQEPHKARILAETKATPDSKDSKKIFKEKNMMEGHFIIDEDAKTVTMVYFDHEGNEMRATHIGLNLDQDLYFVNGNMATPKSFELRMEEEDVVVLNAYLKNGKKIRGAVLPNNNYVTGTWNVNKHFDEQETVYIMDGKKYKVSGGKYVEIELPQKEEPVPFQPMGQQPKFNDGEAGKDGVIEIAKKEPKTVEIPVANNSAKVMVRTAEGEEYAATPLFVIDGNVAPKDFDLNSIDPQTIESIRVLKDGTTSIEKYGDAAKEGVVEITLKKQQQDGPQTFNGGNNADFAKWVQANVKYPKGATKEGRVAVSFTVSETGKVTDVKALTGPEEILNNEAVRVIASSPDWSPAIKDGKPVAIKLVIPVDFTK